MRKRWKTVFWAALVLIALRTYSADVRVVDVEGIRGLAPDLLSKYTFKDDLFACLSGGKPFSASRVNDNYCDCIDGSDEPGTSACPNGHFYCHNRGYLPKLLNSSAVDDNICDCCDGSDESSGKCPATCDEAGKEYRAALKAKSTSMKLGLKAKEKYISKAVTRKKEWKQEVEKLKREKTGLQQSVDSLKARKEKIEGEEEKERAAEEALKKRQEAAASSTSKEELDKSEIDPEENAIADVDPVGETEAKEAKSSIQQEVAKQEPKAEETPAEEEELSAEEQGRRIASQWTQDPEASGHPQETEAASQDKLSDVDPATAAKPSVPKYTVPDMSGDQAEVEPDSSPEASEESGLFSSIKDWSSRVLGWNVLRTPKAERQKVKDNYFAENQKLSELERKQAELEGNLGNDFGPHDAFLTLTDRCFEANIEKYVYEVCPFKSAAQKDGGMSTSLGIWKGFEDDFRAMIFQNGQQCWNGPSRSLRVNLECGSKEELSHVEEPNRCEYQAKLTTPAACLAEDAKQLQAKIAGFDNASKDEL